MSDGKLIKACIWFALLVVITGVASLVLQGLGVALAAALMKTLFFAMAGTMLLVLVMRLAKSSAVENWDKIRNQRLVNLGAGYKPELIWKDNLIPISPLSVRPDLNSSEELVAGKLGLRYRALEKRVKHLTKKLERVLPGLVLNKVQNKGEISEASLVFLDMGEGTHTMKYVFFFGPIHFPVLEVLVTWESAGPEFEFLGIYARPAARAWEKVHLLQD